MARNLMAVLAFAWSAVALGQAVPDPTLLPAGLAAAAVPGAVSASPLQSIILSGGRKLAVIGGQTVALGGTYGDARLVSISPTQVVLRNGTSEEVLTMYQGIRKTPSVTNAEPRPQSQKRNPGRDVR